MGKNSYFGIRILGTNNLIIFEYLGWKIVSLAGHRTYPDTGTVHNQSEIQKTRSGGGGRLFRIF